MAFVTKSVAAGGEMERESERERKKKNCLDLACLLACPPTERRFFFPFAAVRPAGSLSL